MGVLKWARTLLLGLVTVLPAYGAGVAAVALRTVEPPTIDGRLDDAVWRRAATNGPSTLKGWVTMKAPYDPIKNARVVYWAYDQDNLYVIMLAKVDDIWGLESRQDRPELGDTFRVDIGSCATGVDCKGNNLGLLHPYLLAVKQAARIDEDKKTWCAEMAIPWREIGGKPETRKALEFNVSGHDYLDGFVTWARDEHAPNVKAFGRLRLSE